jgi:hypothetical protein
MSEGKNSDADDPQECPILFCQEQLDSAQLLTDHLLQNHVYGGAAKKEYSSSIKTHRVKHKLVVPEEAINDNSRNKEDHEKLSEKRYAYKDSTKHVKNLDNKCPHCPYASSSPTHVTRHIKYVHDKLGDSICPHCDYVTCFRRHLQRHIKAVHDKIKDQKCLSCQFTCSIAENMAQHVKAMHSNIKDNKCTQCAYRQQVYTVCICFKSLPKFDSPYKRCTLKNQRQ